MTEPVTIGFGVNKWIKDSNTRLVNLLGVGAGNSSTVQSLNEMNAAGTGSSAYQVPVGKKFIILAMLLNSKEAYNSYTSQRYWSATSAAGQGFTILDGTYNAASAIAGMLDVYIEIPAGSFISGNSSGGMQPRVIGIETTV